MIWKSKKILITWWNWFIWANLTRKLVDDWFENIFLILREWSNFWRLNWILDEVNIIYWTLDNQDFIYKCVDEIKPDIIYHLAAAWAYIWRDSRWISNLFQTNVLWTINLLNACKEVWFDYFVNTWSNSEYWEKDHPMLESDMLEPNNDYWVTKASWTLYCSYIWKKFELPIYTLRLFAVYWYFEDKSRLIPSLMLNYINNIAPNLSKPDSVRDFIFIEDVISYYLNIDKINWDFWWIYNIWSWVQYSIWDMANFVKNIANSNINPTYWNVSLKQKEPKIWVSNMNKTNQTFWLRNTEIKEWLKKSYSRFSDNFNLYE